MKGLEISRAYWEQYGAPVIFEKFPELKDKIAAGLTGQGSECFGFDDDYSRDHDFDQGFCIFIPGKDAVDERTEFLLERAYYSLPKEFMGCTRAVLNPAGGNRHGVFRIGEYMQKTTGRTGMPEGWRDFLSVPDYALAEAVNGEIFYDGSGEITAIREKWANPPEDVKLKKLCGNLILMSQSGEYNYERCVRRNDIPASLLASNEFVRACLAAAFWAFGRPAPYYKWQFRALKDLDGTAALYDCLADILRAENIEENIKTAAGQILLLLKKNGIHVSDVPELQKTAVMLNDEIKDSELRNLSLLAGV